MVHKVSSWVECNLSEPLGDGCIERFYVGGMEVGVVEEYKYLWSVFNEYLTNVRIVEERGRATAKAPSDWLRKCKAAVGKVKRATFVRLLELLVKAVLLPGVEVWRVEHSLGLWRMCRCWQLESYWEWGDAIHQPSYSIKKCILPLKWDLRRLLI